jgi:hypothetical protein
MTRSPVRDKPTRTCDLDVNVCRSRMETNSTMASSSDDRCSFTQPMACFTSVIASFPFLGVNQSIVERWIGNITQRVQEIVQFVVPRFPTFHDSAELPQLPKAIRELWENFANATQHHSSASDFMLRHFDTNDDGTISRNEMLNITELVHGMMTKMRTHASSSPPPISWITWFRREWPLLDWKLGVFIWRSFGGLLFALALLSIIPGRMHSVSGKMLRWPVLGMTYFLVTVELMYVCIHIIVISFKKRSHQFLLKLQRVHCDSIVHSYSRVSHRTAKAS